MIDPENIQRLADRFKIDRFTIWREYLQLVFLKYFYSAKESAGIFFKGGTAIHLLLGSSRFSEDLDFTSVLTKKETERVITTTREQMTLELPGLLFREDKTIANSFSGRLKVEISGLKMPLTARIDVSFREKPLTPDASPFETIFPVGPFPPITHLSLPELFAEKIRALWIRGQGRDVYDSWLLFSKQVPLAWDMVLKKMALYSQSLEPKKLIERITSVSDRELHNDLAKFLPVNQRPGIPKLKTILLEYLKQSYP